MSPSTPEIAEFSALGLTHDLILGKRQEPGDATLVICRKWRICDFLFISLKEPDAQSEYEFSLKWFFMHNQRHYLAVTYPPDLTGDDDIIPVVVLKLFDKDTVMTLSAQELKEVGPSWIREAERSKRSKPEFICEVMGEFPAADGICEELSGKPEATRFDALQNGVPSDTEKSGLTNLVFIPGDSSGALMVASLGRELAVVRRWRDNNRVFMILCENTAPADKSMPGRSSDLSVYFIERLFEHKHDWYIVLRHLPEFIDPAGVEPHAVLKFTGTDQICTLTSLELAAVEADYMADRRRTPDVSPTEVIFRWGSASINSKGRAVIGLGSDLGDLSIGNLISEGSFSWVFQGTRRNGLSKPRRPFLPAAVKVAKPSCFLCPPRQDKKDRSMDEPWFNATALQSQGLVIGTGYVGTFEPDPEELLVAQAKKIWETDDPALVKVYDIGRNDRCCWCEMELLEGPSLRKMITDGQVPMLLFIELAWSLDRLTRNPGFAHHGDLKPENILIDHGSIRLIDPGWFGRSETMPFQGVVTSPAYYPFLRPDDLFAMGLILWEAAFGRHPFFLAKIPPGAGEPTEENSRLEDWVQRFERTGNYLLGPLRYLPRPKEIKPSVNPETEVVLLKALGLGLVEMDKVDKITDHASAYANFAELAQDLQRLRDFGVEYI